MIDLGRPFGMLGDFPHEEQIVLNADIWELQRLQKVNGIDIV